MVPAGNMVEVSQILQLRGMLLPSAAAEYKFCFRHPLSDFEKKFPHPLLCIPQSVAEKTKSRRKAFIRCNGKMSLRIKPL